MKRALLIGINYKGTDVELRGCVNDILAISSTLQTRYGYNPLNIRILTEDGIKPTRAAILQGIAWLLQGVRPSDTLFFYYSGHGSYTQDSSRDESDGRDETVVPLDYAKSGLISDDWLYANLVQKIPKGVKLWGFADCCHSGTLLDLRYNVACLPVPTRDLSGVLVYSPGDWSTRFGYGLEGTRDCAGSVCFISGSLDWQTAADAWISGKAQGAFTACLLDVLKSPTSKSMTLQNVLKELNCRLVLAGFSGQNAQLSVGRLADLEQVCVF
jgi:hypothetical protein